MTTAIDTKHANDPARRADDPAGRGSGLSPTPHPAQAPRSTTLPLVAILVAGLIVRALLWNWFAGLDLHDD